MASVRDFRADVAVLLDAAIAGLTEVSAQVKADDEWDDEFAEAVAQGVEEAAALAGGAAKAARSAVKAGVEEDKHAERQAKREAKEQAKLEAKAEAAERKALQKQEKYSRVERRQHAVEAARQNADLAEIAAASREKAEAARTMAERLEERLSRSPAAAIANQRIQRSHRRMSRQLNDADDEAAGSATAAEHEVRNVGVHNVAARKLTLEQTLEEAEKALYEEMLLKNAEERFHQMKPPSWLKAWRRGGQRHSEMDADASFTGDCIALAEDGDTLICAGGQCEKCAIGIYSAREGKHLFNLTGHSDVVVSVAVSGDMLASGGRDKTVKLWSIAGRTCLATLTGCEGIIYGLAMRNNVLVTGEGGADFGKARLWSLSTSEDYQVSGKMEAILSEHTAAVWSVGIGIDVALSASHDATALVWPLDTKGRPSSLATLTHPTNVYSVSVEGDAAATACGDKIVRLWSLTSFTCLREMEHGLSPARRASLGPGAETDASAFREGLFPFCVHLAGTVLVSGGGSDKNVKVWNLTDSRPTGSECVATLEHGATVRGVLVSRNGIILTIGGKEKRMLLWKPK